MIRSALMVAVMLGFGFILLAGTLTDLVGLVDEARTNDATEIDVCTTNASGDCIISLSEPHANKDGSGLGITEIAPGTGDVTGNGSLAENLTTINMSGLLATTAYTFNLDYKVVDDNVSGPLNQLLVVFPLLLVVGLLALGLFAAARINNWRS
jgi:hypothetical protein